MQATLGLALVWLLALGSASPCAAQTDGADLRFKPDASGGFAFDTGEVRGRLRPDGKSLGLVEVTHRASGVRIDHGHGLLGHYRVFGNGRRFGAGAWDWPSDATLRDDGWVEVNWPSAADRPFAMKARFGWRSPNTIDVETSVEPKEAMTGFEVFLASYFDAAFTNALAFVEGESKSKRTSVFRTAEKAQGDWLVFPRDEEAMRLIEDGRWKLEPHPVVWVKQPLLAKPIALRRNPATGLTGLLMASSKDCFALSMPYQTETHYSVYFSLFGCDLAANSKATARVRLAITPRWVDSQVLRAYERFLDDRAEP